MKKFSRVLIILIILALYSFYFEPRWVRVIQHTYSSDDVPLDFEGTRIVFVSDIHHGPYLSIKRVKTLVEKVNSLSPDIICLGGDYVHRDYKYINPVFKELSNLKAPLGVYAVLGNHDHWEGKDQSIDAIINAGITYIDNQALWIRQDNSKIKLGGVGDLYENEQNFIPTIYDVTKNNLVILLSHSPDTVELIDNNLIDLTLCGHTHGGQVTLFGLYAPLIPVNTGQKFRTGLVKTDNTTVIISNGYGTITPPVRFFARPQINLVTLERY